MRVDLEALENKIKFVITVKDEEEVFQLIDSLVPQLNDTDTLYLLVDEYEGNGKFVERIMNYIKKPIQIEVIYNQLNGDFASHRNSIHSIEKLHNTFICQLDADEVIDAYFVQLLNQAINHYQDVQLFYIPRKNIVHGLTTEDIIKWKWNVNKDGYINYPDYQGRLYFYKEDDTIKWVGKVHERISGHKLYATLPDIFAISHIKNIDRQRKQNELYDKLG